MPGRRSPVLLLETEKRPAMTIVRCTGKVIIETGALFSSTVRELIPEGKPIRVDLTHVVQVDSVGIGTFVSVWASAKKNGVDLKFRNPSKFVEDVVRITRLHNLMEDLPDESKATPA